MRSTVIAAHFADERVTAKSHRIGFSLPGTHGYYYAGISPALTATPELPLLVKKIAKPALPHRMREHLPNGTPSVARPSAKPRSFAATRTRSK